MRLAHPLHRLALLLACAGSLSAQQTAALRTWTDVQGRKVEASFNGLQGDAVQLALKDGKVVPFPLAQLSAEDQAFVKAQPAPSAAAPATDATRPPPDKRVWPDKVEVSARTMEKLQLVTEEPGNRKYVYRTDSFEFLSQDKLAGSVMTEIARTFEATRLLVAALPWGIICKPPPPLERYQAALYETREDYFNNGGPQNSGGVYDSGDMIFKIPIPSLGLERRIIRGAVASHITQGRQSLFVLVFQHQATGEPQHGLEPAGLFHGLLAGRVDHVAKPIDRA